MPKAVVNYLLKLTLMALYAESGGETIYTWNNYVLTWKKSNLLKDKNNKYYQVLDKI